MFHARAMSMALAVLAASAAWAQEEAAEPSSSLRASGSPQLSASLGIGPGMSLEGGPAAFEVSLRGLADIPLTMDRLLLRVSLPLRFSTLAHETRYGSLSIRTSMFGFAVVPTIQAGTRILPQLQIYASFGLGPAHFRATTEAPFVGLVHTNATVLEVDFTAGLEYAFDDQFSLYFDPMGLRMFAGSGSSTDVNGVTVSGARGSTEWTMLLGATMRL